MSTTRTRTLRGSLTLVNQTDRPVQVFVDVSAIKDGRDHGGLSTFVALKPRQERLVRLGFQVRALDEVSYYVVSLTGAQEQGRGEESPVLRSPPGSSSSHASSWRRTRAPVREGWHP